MAQTEQQQIQMYGCTTAAIEEDAGVMLKPPLNLMYIMGILSDVQEANERGDTRSVRQWCNKAKYLIAELKVEGVLNVETV